MSQVDTYSQTEFTRLLAHLVKSVEVRIREFEAVAHVFGDGFILFDFVVIGSQRG